MIVYGHNNFLIKSYTPEELGLPQEEGSAKVQLEIRQRYAHLFWIPFFPIGKLWVMRQAGDKNMYQMPEDLKNIIIEQHGTPGTPWYSFFLLLLAALAGFIFILTGIQEKRNDEAYFYNRVDETRMLIKYPTTGDYYVFIKHENPQTYAGDKIILKVKSYDENSIEFISLYDDLYKDAESNDHYHYKESFDAVEAFAFNPTKIKKEALYPAIDQEYRGMNESVKIEPLEGYYSLMEIDRRKLE